MPVQLSSGCSISICRVIIVLLLIVFGLFSEASASRLAAGGATVVVKSDSTVLAWGLNQYSGQVGDGTYADRLSPVHVVDALGVPITGVQAVASSRYHTTALGLDGTLMAWGGNRFGQLGDGTKIDKPYAIPVVDENGTPFNTVKEIAAMQHHTIAVRLDGSLWAWGYNANGQLGDGTIIDRPNPVPVRDGNGNPVSGIQSVAAGDLHHLALRTDGLVLAWGYNTSGQLGDGTTDARTNPVVVLDTDNNPIIGIQAVAAGAAHTIALKTDGSLLAWGNNTFGQLGDGTITHRSNPVPVVDESGESITGILTVAAGGYHTVALKSDGTVLTWGRNNAGQLGDGTTSDRHYPVYVLDQLGGDPISCIQEVSAGNAGSSTFALKMDGTVLAWGKNSEGQLGDGTKDGRVAPVSVLETALMDIRAVAAGGSHTFALNVNGNLLAWGSNSYGQLGDGTTNKRYIPGLVLTEDGDPIEGIKAVSAASNHVLALKLDGTVLGWGYNHDGQIGDGTIDSRYNPVPVVDESDTPITDIQAVSAGGSFSLALKTDNSLLAWGDNDDGQLGDGSIVNKTTPVSVMDAQGNPITDIQAVSAGTNHSLALKTDGTLLSWGNNYYGQLGDGTTFNRLNPVIVKDGSGAAITGVKAISAGGQFSIALMTNGSLLAWGRNAWGVLGDGTTEDRHYPVPVLAGPGTPLTGITAVASGPVHVLALQLDTGSLLAWGNNFYGQLGNNEVGSEYGYNPVPSVVVRNSLGDSATGFRTMSVGISHSVAVLNDNILNSEGVAAWGLNDDGQVGIWNFTVNYTRPELLIRTPAWNVDAVPGVHLHHPLNLGWGVDGMVQFTSGDESIVEGDGSILITVSRVCSSTGAASVEYTTSDGTAAAGEDYTSQSGTLSWLDGETTPQQISIPVTGDSSEEGDETFMVTLSNGVGASLGIPDTITVTIVNKIQADTDDDGVPDALDDFPTDVAASLDTDNDGDPDDWNPGKTEADSTTGLILDLDDDNDGMPDDWEILHGLTPLIDDAGDDRDGDGINNFDEYLNGSSPLLKSGDINLDDAVSLPDGISGLKILTLDDLQPIPADTGINADTNMDKVIGTEDIIFILKEASQ